MWKENGACILKRGMDRFEKEIKEQYFLRDHVPMEIYRGFSMYLQSKIF